MLLLISSEIVLWFSHDFPVQSATFPRGFPPHLRMRLGRGLRPLHGGVRQALRCVLFHRTPRARMVIVAKT